MISSHAPPCLFLGITMNAKKIGDNIPSDTSIFGAKTQSRKKQQKYLFELNFLDNSNA
jgi:hypothetical protein